MFRLIVNYMERIDKNIFSLGAVVVIIACLEVFLFSSVDMINKIEACFLGILMMLISSVFFYFFAKLISIAVSIFGPFKFGSLALDKDLILNIYSFLFLIIGVYFFIAYPIFPHLVGADGEMPINLLVIIPSIYWGSRKNLTRLG